ncbi:MAG: hypothetical protein ACJAYJ_003201 [Saprospiraceae bacterium]|jgi:hypothetical protein
MRSANLVTKMKIIIPITIALIILLGCNKDDDLPTTEIIETIDPTPDPTVINYTSNRSSNLNVVYFIPNDKDTLNDYQRRLSGIMLHAQEWYKKEMNSYGFGEKTFGLLVDEKDAQRIKIIVINGQNNANYYPYEGGGAKANIEIEKYFNDNPNETTSAHTVVFMPSREGDHGWDAGGVPFYGIGRWCYVLDYLNFDMNTWRDGTQEGSTNWIGGTIHEIGHALNLPHNQHKADDGWIAMMAWGNHEYNDDPENVHLTKASAVILNNNQVFNDQPASNFYAEIPSHTIKSLRIYADDTNLYVKSKFDVSIGINGVNIYNDPKTSIDDSNYNAVSWATANIINNDSISVVMPLSGINQEYKQYPFELSIRFCHTNGNFSYESFQYEFVNNKPDIDIDIFSIEEVDKTNWTITGASSEETSGEGAGNGHAEHAIDSNSETFWHSQWQSSQPSYPHSFTINLNVDQIIKGFTFYNRTNKYNGRPNNITIETSTDGSTFENLGDFTLEDGSARQSIELTTPITIQYFKVTITSGYDDNSGENVFFTHLAEVGLY